MMVLMGPSAGIDLDTHLYKKVIRYYIRGSSLMRYNLVIAQQRYSAKLITD